MALITGFLKHGYLALKQIYLDPELPFAQPYLQRHIRSVFIDGLDGQPPVISRSLFESETDAERWVECASLCFPDEKEAESRILQVLSSLTEHLPARHFAKVTISGRQSLESPASVAEGEQIIIDSSVIPGRMLRQFVEESSKRRRLNVLDSNVAY